jgi:uncharacterized protein YprB with RNaseH-like and TPR domain
VIERSFIHLPGIGPGTERRLWRNGLRAWHDLLAHPGPPAGVSRPRWDTLRAEVHASVAALRDLDHAFFSSRLPAREHWRALRRFGSRVAYVDIETTGMGAWADITVVGLYDGLRVRTYIHGENLDDLEEDLARYSLLVTFNGASFDLPYLRRRFPRVSWDHLHVDLRHVLRRLGYKGGLKAIEGQCALHRAPDIAHLDGFDAVRLWEEYRRGSDEALELLVRYNSADITNLEALADLAYRWLEEEMLREMDLPASYCGASSANSIPPP